MTHYFLSLCLILTLMSCAPFAPEKRRPEHDKMPLTYSVKTIGTDSVHRWWESFGDVQLNAFVEEALEKNYTLQQSWARLRQARALTVIRGAPRFPDLRLNAAASTGRQQVADGQTAQTKGVENYSLGLLSNYEIDLWGRIRSQRQAAALSEMASEHDLNTVALTLSSNVTTRWIGVISQRMQKQLLKVQLQANKTLAELVELRFRKSLASALDVFQQRQLVAQSQAQIPLLERDEQQLLNELALLLGRMPRKVPQVSAFDLTIPEDIPKTGLPVQLLTARPDIQAAMRRLEAADWNVAAAKADRLPNLRLTAGATYQADALNLLWDNWLVNLMGDLMAPFLDGGRRKAEVERLTAVVEENLAIYRQTILAAVTEVEDALVDEVQLRAHLQGLQAQLVAAQSALDEARSRYLNGLSDYLPVLTQLLTVQNLERSVIQRKAELLVARVNLFRALGGSGLMTSDTNGAGRNAIIKRQMDN